MMAVSTASETVIRCDYPTCMETLVEGGLTRKIVVRMARQDGWAIYGGGQMSYCPKHRIRPLRSQQ